MSLRDQVKRLKLQGLRHRMGARSMSIEVENQERERSCFDAVLSGLSESGEYLVGGFSFQRDAEARWPKVDADGKAGVVPEVGFMIHCEENVGVVYRVVEVNNHASDVEYKVRLEGSFRG